MSKCLMVALVILAGTAARAGDKEAAATAEAKTLYAEGMKQYNLNHLPDALKAFEAAYLAKPAPEFLFNIGQCHRQMGNLKEELYAYRRFLGASPGATNRSEVEKFIADAEAEIARKAAVAAPAETLPMKETAPLKETTPVAEIVPANPPMVTTIQPDVAPTVEVASAPQPRDAVAEAGRPSMLPILLVVIAGVVLVGAIVVAVVATSGTSYPQPSPAPADGTFVVRF